MSLWHADRFTIIDGGMGTMLQRAGLVGGERPERWNAVRRDSVLAIHEQYLAAGAQIVSSNTFGATEAHLGADAETLMILGVKLAREAVRRAGRGYVAVDMGSLGEMIAPYGAMPFEEAVRQFRQAFACGIRAGGDLLLIETMTDQREAKAAVLGAREAMEQTGATLPLWCSLSFDLNGRLLTGADIEGAAAMLEGLRVDAIGLNCGYGPAALHDNVRRLCAATRLPVFVSPNAGLPQVVDGATVFPTAPDAFAAEMLALAALGVQGLGGCCGTTPAHLSALVAAVADMRPAPREASDECVVSGRAGALKLGGRPVVIGERLNPTGKPRMKQALRDGDMDALMREAVDQLEAGADALDVNVGLPEIDEVATLPRVVEAVQRVCDRPLQIDTADTKALEAALRCYNGKPLINSVSGKRESMDAVLPLAARYGGAVVALCLDEQGIPDTADGRLDIARRIIAQAQRYGIDRRELLFDALTLTVATDPQAARTTLETVRRLHDELHVKTVLGASNASFGLPQRPVVNAAFVAMAVHAGLDAAILNPLDALCRSSFDAAAAVCGRAGGMDAYVARYAGMGKLGLYEEASVRASAAANGAITGDSARQEGNAVASKQNMGENLQTQSGDADASASHQPLEAPLCRAIVTGLAAQAATQTDALLDGGQKPLDVAERYIMSALTEVGARYERGATFLPQLMQSAEAATAAFERVRARLPVASADGARRVVVATVHGDVHDIGKNIAKVLLQNYGYDVIDLGRDVPPETVVQAARDSGAPLVGLSALMTTTVPAMRQTIALLHSELPGVKTVVGGAVLTQSYASEIGADYYAPDAMATVRAADEVFAALENDKKI